MSTLPPTGKIPADAHDCPPCSVLISLWQSGLVRFEFRHSNNKSSQKWRCQINQQNVLIRNRLHLICTVSKKYPTTLWLSAFAKYLISSEFWYVFHCRKVLNRLLYESWQTFTVRFKIFNVGVQNMKYKSSEPLATLKASVRLIHRFESVLVVGINNIWKPFFEVIYKFSI